jgi:serine/threonine protein kinase/formylglycine-generating enzyme required for sulfatase activity
MSDNPTPTPAGDPTDWQPPTPEELQVLLPQYEITALIGRGGMGAVYRGNQASLDRPVAIKILPPGLEQVDATYGERFRNEALAMGRLNHPGLVGVFDFGRTSNGMLYIVMEFVDGTDVAQMMAKQGRLSSEHAMAITAHVCDALKYAHDRGIVHRDIKPANIMVGYDGVVKVADFGLAKVSQDGSKSGLTQTGMAMGTMHYIAPEAMILGVMVDQRADIYAMGVMLYQMLTGTLPQGMFELPSLQVKGLDPRYDGIITRALRNDRELRYQNVLELRRDLDAILTQPVTAVEANAKKAPAALNTTARPQRPAGPPPRPPQKQTPPSPTPKKKIDLGFWAPVVGVAVACAGFVVWMERTKLVTGGTPQAPNIVEATKERPFTNSLGMKFVPVPGTGNLMCIHETRKQDYAAFAVAMKNVHPRWKDYQAFHGNVLTERADEHPVKNVTHDDVVGFCQWLSKEEDKTYRLPTDKEWSYAIGIGPEESWTQETTPETRGGKIKDVFSWGTIWPPPKDAGNLADTALNAAVPNEKHFIDGYTDGFPAAAPVMSFQPNHLGIYDLSGNVAEWVEDWWNSNQKDRAIRGSAYFTSERHIMFSSHRGHLPPSVFYGNANVGFRCVVEIDSAESSSAVSSSTSSSTASAAPSEPGKAILSGKPFTNILGMKFVPVPGTQVLMCIHETRKRDYAVFANENPSSGKGWKNPVFEGMKVSPGDDHPVVNVSSLDGDAFCQWLSKKRRAHLSVVE